MKKQPQKIRINELAELCGLTPRRLYQLAAEKKIPAATKGEFPKVESIKALFVWFARDSENLKREKLLLVTATRELKQEELCTAKGQTIRRDVAESTARYVVNKLRDFFRAENEVNATASRKEKLEQLGATPEIVATFYEWDLKEAANRDDRVYERCQKAATETKIKPDPKNEN